MPKRNPGGGEDAAGLPRLPPGRHGLPREFVTENQRSRLAAGVIAAVSESGYHDATITQIAAKAGVSRRTFYGYFSSKEECFLAAYDLIGTHLREAATEAAAHHREWPERVRAQLEALLGAFAANPDLARFFLIAPARAGSGIAARYRLAMERAIATLGEVAPPPAASRRPSPAAKQAMVGGTAALIVRKVEAGEGDRLPDLLPDLLELVLTPYLGREEAQRLARRAP